MTFKIQKAALYIIEGTQEKCSILESECPELGVLIFAVMDLATLIGPLQTLGETV